MSDNKEKTTPEKFDALMSTWYPMAKNIKLDVDPVERLKALSMMLVLIAQYESEVLSKLGYDAGARTVLAMIDIIQLKGSLGEQYDETLKAQKKARRGRPRKKEVTAQ